MRLPLLLCVCAALLGSWQVRGQEPGSSEKAPAPSEKDPGRPVLKRGGPAEKRTDSGPAKTESNVPKTIRELPPGEHPPPDPDSRAEIAAEPAPSDTRPDGPPQMQRSRPAGSSPVHEDPLIEKARQAVADFTESLPSFVCDQLTNRYQNKRGGFEWKHMDRLEVELVYRNGQEDYRNVRRNGKRIKLGDEERTGQTSTGDFATALADLFEPRTHARFLFRRDSSASGQRAKVYEFNVLRVNGGWTIRVKYDVRPAYSGLIWIEPESGRVLRMERTTKSLPDDYTIDKVEQTVDYDWVMLAEKKFLLPVRSENLSCLRGTSDCSKNVIEFKNYHKFEAESQILATDSTLSFPEADEPKTDPKQTGPKRTPPQITPKQQ